MKKKFFIINKIHKNFRKGDFLIQSIFYFIIAGIFEIGGGYCIWLWLREDRSILYGVAGSLLLILYGYIPTLQTENFGRVYAAYGGIFIVLSILWGWKIDDVVPDKFDITGGIIALIGVGTILYAPR
jgi:small multidrug resistance family-3 protein